MRTWKMRVWLVPFTLLCMAVMAYILLTATTVDRTAPKTIVPVQVKEDQIEIVGRYCIDGTRVIHYNIKRWSQFKGEYVYLTSHGGAKIEFNVHYGNC